MKVNVVIVAWNQLDKTKECIQSILNQKKVEVSIILVDNGSTDGTTKVISELFPTVYVIQLKNNKGPTKGYNIGLRKAIAPDIDFIFLINNDAIIDEICLSILINRFLENPDAGLVFPLMLYKKIPNKIWAGGNIRKGLFSEKDLFGNALEDDISLSHQKIINAPFCGVMFSRFVFEKVGFLDENFILYFEDADFCERVRVAGMNLYIEPKAKLWHYVSSSTGGQFNPIERYWMTRSGTMYYLKHNKYKNLVFFFIFFSFSLFKVSVKYLIYLKFNLLKAIWNGYFDGLRKHLFNHTINTPIIYEIVNES
jgi:GT2 family glycosyltransferase